MDVFILLKAQSTIRYDLYILIVLVGVVRAVIIGDAYMFVSCMQLQVIDN